MRRVRCENVPEKDAIRYLMWCERPYKEAAEDHLRVTPIRSGRHRYRQRGLYVLDFLKAYVNRQKRYYNK